MKRMLFVYNPRAGKSQIKNRLSGIVEVFSNAKYEVVIYPTKGRMDAHNVVMKRGAEYDLLVCSGGDGTMNEVVSGLMQIPKEKRPQVGYIPAGTVNDFARSLKIPRDMQIAAKTAIGNKVFACDIGSMNDKYFTYIAGFGAFTEVSYETSQDVKNILGKAAYFMDAVMRVPNIQAYSIKAIYDGGEVEGEFIFGMVTNSKSVGGFKGLTGTDVYLDDGQFDVMLIRMPKNPIELQNIINALLMKQYDEKYLFYFHSSAVTLEAEAPIPWVLDGESGGIWQNVNIRNHNQAIQFKVK